MPLKLTQWKRLPEEQKGSARHRLAAPYGRANIGVCSRLENGSPVKPGLGVQLSPLPPLASSPNG